MKYNLYKKEKKFELIDFPNEVEGLEIKPKIKTEEDMKIKNMVLSEKKFIKTYVIKNINKKFDKIIMLINKMLNSEDNSSSDVGVVLDEVQKIKSTLISKYKQYLTEKQYKDFLTKIIITEEEFKVRYNQKIMFEQIKYMNYTEEQNMRR